ncbi:hypothetical protein [Aquipseudomonas guryensis]|jgi:hypothetical protein|uniref:Uncharacterized protein n=1 Tax=Aquipseudomonas guryensis TaxID=2759165 RepID=A0A7W4DEP8_9GAMM|nr:hypothetical protein [Pseudomonas guryensis]MBB1521205.1 hypothetical protein [Pseudomonas guryensis]
MDLSLEKRAGGGHDFLLLPKTGTTLQLERYEASLVCPKNAQNPFPKNEKAPDSLMNSGA